MSSTSDLADIGMSGFFQEHSTWLTLGRLAFLRNIPLGMSCFFQKHRYSLVNAAECLYPVCCHFVCVCLVQHSSVLLTWYCS